MLLGAQCGGGCTDLNRKLGLELLASRFSQLEKAAKTLKHRARQTDRETDREGEDGRMDAGEGREKSDPCLFQTTVHDLHASLHLVCVDQETSGTRSLAANCFSGSADLISLLRVSAWMNSSGRLEPCCSSAWRRRFGFGHGVSELDMRPTFLGSRQSQNGRQFGLNP